MNHQTQWQLFFAKVNKDGPVPPQCPELGPCWLWMGSKRKHGHGYFWYDGVVGCAHRFSIILTGVEIPEGFEACHHCDTGACVNPNHIFLGTHADNMGDAQRKGRNVRGEKNSRLKNQDVLELRKMYDEGMAIKDIMAIKSLGRSIVAHIVHRTRWKHI